jgi:hypothetical protein
MAEIPAVFVHDDYEKITDDLMWLGYSKTSKCSYLLRFNVSLSNMSNDGKKMPFHTEYRYETRKYSNVFAGNTIRRHMTYYLSIESSRQDEFGNKDFIMIRACDILYIRSQFEIIYHWFMGDIVDGKYIPGIYGTRDNKMVIFGQHELIIKGLNQGNYIIIHPCVMDNKGEMVSGVVFTINNGNSFEVNMDSFMELYYLIGSIDMYNAASTLMAYFGRPPFGTNMWQPNDQNKIYENQEPDIDKLEGNKRRQLKKGFFD